MDIIVTNVVILALLLAFTVGLVAAAIKYTGWFLGGLAVVCLATSCAHADDLRLEVSVVMESEADRAAIDEAVNDAAYLYRTQLGVELVVTHYSTSTVAEHTKGEALLDSLKMYRAADPKHAAADVTVLFTRRALTRGYEGIASGGPACSASASAIIRLRADGLDGEILAHEITHTVGVPHDRAPGWLMSESLARVSARTFSDDAVRTFKAAPLAECMATIEPRAAQTASGGVPPTKYEPAGGGGSMDWPFIVLLLAFAGFAILQQKHIVEQDQTNREHLAEIAELETELVKCRPSDFCLRDMTEPSGFAEDGYTRTVLIRFTTLAGATDFLAWLKRQRKDAEHGARHGA